jgi:NAD/NADP transhydrogenase alpha subunit
MFRILIPREDAAFETRVAGTPDSVKKLKALGGDVFVQEGAGRKSFFSDAEYVQAGAHVVPNL